MTTTYTIQGFEFLDSLNSLSSAEFEVTLPDSQETIRYTSLFGSGGFTDEVSFVPDIEEATLNGANIDLAVPSDFGAEFYVFSLFWSGGETVFLNVSYFGGANSRITDFYFAIGGAALPPGADANQVNFLQFLFDDFDVSSVRKYLADCFGRRYGRFCP